MSEVKKALLFAVFAGSSLLTVSQQRSFSNYSIEQGLSQSVVNCLMQDSKGFIWIGTQHGLNKFNGSTFDIYTFNPSDSASLSNKWVYSLAEDTNGNILVLTKGGVNLFDRVKKAFSRLDLGKSVSGNAAGYPYDVVVSRSGKIYFNMAPDLVSYDPRTGSIERYTSKLAYDGSVKDLRIPVLEDQTGKIWIGSTRGLCVFDPGKGTFDYFIHDRGKRNSLNSNNITALFEDREGSIWIGTSLGVDIYKPATGTIEPFCKDWSVRFPPPGNTVRAIIQDPDGSMWIGTEGGGLSRLSGLCTGGKTIETFTNENNGLAHNIVNCLMPDRTGNLWIGTLKGVSKTDLKPPKFKLYRKDNSSSSVDLLGNVIASLYKDQQGRIWVGTWGQGLNIYDRKTGKVRHFSTRFTGARHIVNDYVHCIFRDKFDRIWIGTRDGMMIMDQRGNAFRPFREVFRGKGIPDFRGLRINKILEDLSGNYWVATQNGVYCFNPGNGYLRHFSAEAPEDSRLSGNLVYSVVVDHEGKIWMATMNGLDVYDPARRIISHYRRNNVKGSSISDDYVIALCVDHNGDVWIGTGTGVNKFVKSNSGFLYFSQANGLPNDQVFEILEDDRHDLWFATGKGLTRFNPVAGNFRIFGVEEGLQSLEFNLRAACKGSDGEMFFGGMNGFNSFYPDSVYDNPYVPEIRLTSLVRTGGDGTVISTDTENLNEITFGHNDYSFTIDFVALEYTNPAKNRYAYRMEGISDQWIEIGNRRFVPFSNLPAGEYVFRVKGSNNDGVWNEQGASLKITVLPAWYQSVGAYVVYVIALILVVVFFIRWRVKSLVAEKNVLEEKIRVRTKQIEAQRDMLLRSREELDTVNKELEKRVEERTAEYLRAKEKAESGDRLKTAFMHNISHEIRTPLNGILGFGQMMLDEELSTGERRQYFDVLQRSADRLLNTVTNYMDISLIVTGNMEVSLKWIEPVSILNELYTRYQRVAGPKNLNFSLSLPPGTAGRRFLTDQELLSKIMGHLLDNAIKFTTEGSVEYGFVIADEELRFFVRDTGNGIAEADRDFIFEHFSQAGQVGQAWHEGSGLGLSIAKGMVNMLGGRIWLKSTPGKGTTFFFALPGVLTPVVDGHLQRTAVKRNGTPVVLVAEDEESNLTLVSWYLEKENLEVVTVADGLQAVEACRKNEAIGLVLMDLKMPVMDGYKATAEIRTFAPRIPVIAVTAYALSGDMKKVMEAGFDDYLPKPFSREALHGCLKNFGMIG